MGINASLSDMCISCTLLIKATYFIVTYCFNSRTIQVNWLLNLPVRFDFSSSPALYSLQPSRHFVHRMPRRASVFCVSPPGIHISLVICVWGYTYHGDTHVTVTPGGIVRWVLRAIAKNKETKTLTTTPYCNKGILQIREKRMTFLFPESISTFTKLQPKEKLFNLQNLLVIRAQNPFVSTRFFIACKLYITMNGRVFITLILDLSFSKINRPLDIYSKDIFSPNKTAVMIKNYTIVHFFFPFDWIGQVRYINILTWLRGCQDKLL